MEGNIKIMTNAERMAEALKRNGVTFLFGQSNPSAITLACHDIGIKQIGYRQENAGTYMAQAYAMMTGKVPVVTAQNGPAATLLIPGLAECVMASHPMVAIVQDVPLSGVEKNTFQEYDQEQLFMGSCKWVKKITSKERIEDFIDMAFRIAASGRPGPAVLLIPQDIIYDRVPAEVDLGLRKTNSGIYPLDRPVANPEDIEKAAQMLAAAENPVIYAGGGVHGSRALEELREIQEECAIPVGTTMMGKGVVDECHPLSLGTLGQITGKRGMGKFTSEILKEADVVLLVGNRTNQDGTDSWTLLPRDAKYIHIDIAPEEISRNYESLRLTGDAKATLKALKTALLKQNLKKRTDARKEIEDRIREGRNSHEIEALDAVTSNESPVRIERFMAEAERFLTDDHVLVADASFSSIWLANYFKATANRKFIFPRGLAGLGWGLPMAMGVNIAEPDRKVFCLVGDGGFAHVWSELEACKRHGLRVVLVVINNGVLGFQAFAEMLRCDGRYTDACDLSPMDHVKVAEACGVKGIRLEKSEDIVPVLEEAMTCDESVVIDLITDVKRSIPPRTNFKALETMF